MTTTQATEIKAGAQETSPADPGNTSPRKDDYTKYFYKNIDRLWNAIMQLQEENSKLRQQMKNASVVLNGGK